MFLVLEKRLCDTLCKPKVPRICRCAKVLRIQVQKSKGFILRILKLVCKTTAMCYVCESHDEVVSFRRMKQSSSSVACAGPSMQYIAKISARVQTFLHDIII